MPNILDEIFAHKYTEIEARKALLPLSQLVQEVPITPSGKFVQALEPQAEKPVRFILEIKPASPSAGVMAENPDLNGLLSRYNPFASALSVLTDKTFFKGSLDLLREVKSKTPHPILCKDFILDPYQIYEAQNAGADAILLIVKILSDHQLQTLSTLAQELGIAAVIEIQNEQELERALAIQPKILLINNRNLEDFTIDFKTTLSLAPLIPAEVTIISASGIENRQDIDTLLPVCSTFLIGSTLMKTPVEQLSTRLRGLLNEAQD